MLYLHPSQLSRLKSVIRAPETVVEDGPDKAMTAARAYAAGSIALVLVMCLRIISTYSVFSRTYDEPYHIGCGMEWLDKAIYQYEAQHPPLSRIAAAIGPYLAGERSHGFSDPQQEGNAILRDGARYNHNLALARLGELPFAILTVVGVWTWALHYFGSPAAFMSTLLASMLPPLLAHGGLATTDIAVTATCTWAFYSLLRFVDDRSWKWTIALGIWCGLVLDSKFSAIPFLATGFIAILLVRFVFGTVEAHESWRGFLSKAAVAAVVSCLLVWACFRFTFAPLFQSEELLQRSGDFAPALTRPGLIHSVVTQISVPAGQFCRGVGQVWCHTKSCSR